MVGSWMGCGNGSLAVADTFSVTIMFSMLKVMPAIRNQNQMSWQCEKLPITNLVKRPTCTAHRILCNLTASGSFPETSFLSFSVFLNMR